ncbi:GNAT family N-acetyltransferase [Pontixanthobacter aestiaquae]|nr:GNAT family N-acetyltransferase [Pontixanthobacter aestiaquae]MDN3645273.1 GNAT family N-acetyltransferase [Pontixanthobacter aestiaquae]
MLSVSYHDTVNVLQGTIQKSRDQNAGPFDRFEWLDLLAKSGAEPLIAVAEDGNAKVALPLMRTTDRLEALTNWYNFTWRPLYSSDPKLLEAVAHGLRSQTHRIVMSPIPEEDGSASTIEAAFRAAGWNVLREHCDHNHVLDVKGRSFADYWAQRPGRMRTTLKRKAKKVDVELLTRFDANAWAEYEAVYENSWKPEEGDPDLLRAFAEQEGAAGRVRLAIGRHEGIAVAAQFWTVEDGIAYIHKLAHLEEHKALSAGTTLSAALFEHVMDTDKVQLIDFGTGNDPYKRDWMEEDRPRYRIDCLDPRQPKAWPALAKRIVTSLAPRSP